jgi:two-component system LytT family response regulator/two-component system response regulator AlgR
MIPLRVLVVDDEPLARERLSRLLREAGCEVAAELVDGPSLIEWMATHTPVDVLFVDIQMPGPSGIEVLVELKDPPLVVFVTAYSEYAIRAFEAAAVDYLLKPVYQDRLAKTLQRVDSRLLRRLTVEEWKAILPPLQRVPIRAGGGQVFLDIKHISHFELVDDRVWAITADKRLLTRWTTLKEAEQAFPEVGLLRIQRNILLRPQAVLGCRSQLGGRLKVLVSHNLELSVSRAMTLQVKARLALP